MEIGSFFKLLLKHKYTLLIIPLIAVIITFFLVRNQADVYSSQSQIATGIVDQTKQSLSLELLGDSKIEQEFSNIIELIKSKKMLDQVSYALIIHDLTSKTPFRNPSKLLLTLNADAKMHALAVYKQLYSKREPLSLFNNDQSGLYRVLTSMKYDDQSLSKNLNVYRTQNSDFVTIQVEADNPQLAAFIVNTLSAQIVDYYEYLLETNQAKAANYLKQLLRSKKDTLDNLTSRLRDYKIQNGILDIAEQARSLYQQLTNYGARLTQAKQDAIATQEAMNNIDAQFDPADRRYIESTLIKVNQRIQTSQAQLRALDNKYVASGFQPQYKNQIDSLVRVITGDVGTSSDKVIVNPLGNKTALITQKLTLQVQHDLAKYSINSLQAQVDVLNRQLKTLVPQEAIIVAYTSAITVASTEYIEILKRYNAISLEANFNSRLRLVDVAMPGLPQPSKKMLLVILSGIISFVFCLLVFFVLFLLDTNLKNPRELANSTKTPVIGYLNLLETRSIDLNKVWLERDPNADISFFRKLLQSIRYEISNELKGDKVLIVNSILPGEGKTYLAMNLAYAYASINKHVLVIDGNFDHPGISKLANAKWYIEDYLTGKGESPEFHSAAKISVMGNKSLTSSLYEISDSDIVKQKLNELKNWFDIIIIETSALETLNKAKEWIVYSDKIVTVFEACQSFNQTQESNLEYLRSLDERFIGWVMNMVPKDQIENK